MKLLNIVVPLVVGSVIWLSGCSKDPSPEASPEGRVPLDPIGNPVVSNRLVPTNWVSLNPVQLSELVRAVNQYAPIGRGDSLPSAMQDLKPMYVYRSNMNVVIAMRREQGDEVGYYFQPGYSSHHVGAEPSPEWSFMPLSGFQELGTVCYAYRRIMKEK